MLSRLLVSLFFLSTLYANLDHTDALENEVNRKMNLGDAYVEGDILVSPHSSRARRQARTDRNVKWKNGMMYYEYDKSVSEGSRKLLEDAMDYMRNRTCSHTGHRAWDYSVLISSRESQGCASYVGRQIELPQDFFFADSCQLFGVAVHELMHALGIYHQHVRHDRDEYLDVDMKNFGSDYQKKTNRTSVNYVPFDYGSAMLYGANPSMKPIAKNMDYYYTMGSRRVVFYDMKTLYEFYGCYNQYPGDAPVKCENGGYAHYIEDECICPTGYGGNFCEKLASGDNVAVYNVTQNWVGYQSSLTYDGNTDNARSHYQTGILIFRAPSPSVTIEFQLTKMTNFTCTTGCSFGSVEVKYKGDPRITSPLICCTENDMWQRVYSPKNDVLIVTFDTRQKNVEIEYKVRYVNKKPNNGKKVTNGYDKVEYYDE